MTLTSMDLFAGAGGLTEGLEAAGLTCLWANEVEPIYADTFRANHPDAIVETGDIRTIDANEVRSRLGLDVGELDLLAGGPPCQGFSVNAPSRSTDDPRNHLFRQYLRFVDTFQPKAILIENVPGLISFNGGETLDSIIAALTQLGYASDVRILYAPHYGVPQTRWRTFIIGLRQTTLPPTVFPLPTHSAPARVNFTSTWQGRTLVTPSNSLNLSAFTTVQDAIGDLPPLSNGEIGAPEKPYTAEPANWYQKLMRGRNNTLTDHEAPRLSRINMERLSHIPIGGNWTDIPRDLLPRGMQRARITDHTKRYGRPRPDGLASTILTKCDPHWGAYFHPEQDRAFTIREAARLQSFPDHYSFTGSRSDRYAQVGNAVPPLLARAVGTSILQAMRESSLIGTMREAS